MDGSRTRSFLFLASVLVVGIIIGLVMQTIDRLLGLPYLLSGPGNTAGLVPIVVGSWLRFWAGSVFYEQNPTMVSFKTPSKLVTGGPWKHSRNPLYLGLILMGLGFSILFASYSDLLLTLAGTVLLHFQVRHEEKLLSKAFGEPYLEYKKRVRRWI